MEATRDSRGFVVNYSSTHYVTVINRCKTHIKLPMNALHCKTLYQSPF